MPTDYERALKKARKRDVTSDARKAEGKRTARGVPTEEEISLLMAVPDSKAYANHPDREAVFSAFAAHATEAMATDLMAVNSGSNLPGIWYSIADSDSDPRCEEFALSQIEFVEKTAQFSTLLRRPVIGDPAHTYAHLLIHAASVAGHRDVVQKLMLISGTKRQDKIAGHSVVKHVNSLLDNPI